MIAPLPGALLGAALAFQLYFRQPGLNTETAAPLVFGTLWALGGLTIGATGTSVAAWLLQRWFRRGFDARPLIATGIALLFLGGLCYGLYPLLQARLPALVWRAQAADPSPAPVSQPSPCSQAPPVDARERKAWEHECR